MVVDFDIDTDLDEIKQAEKIARSLRAFQGRVDLSVEGREELKDALDLADKMDQLRTVKVQVQGQQDLKRAAELAEDLDQTRKVRVDVDDADLKAFDEQLAGAGEAGAEGIADALGGIDFDSIGRAGFDQLSGALGALGPWGAVAAAVGVAFGDDLVGGFESGFNKRRNDVMRAIASGLDEADLRAAGEGAGEAWAAGFGESTGQLKADADDLKRILDDMVADADMGDLVKQSQVLAGVLGVDVPDAALLARRSIKQGLADDWQDAFDDMVGVTQEFGQTGIEALDVLEEFGPNFARFEVDGGRALRFVASAFEDGLVPSIDRSGEAFEEFTTRVIDADAADAISELGLNFTKVQEDIAKGGPAASSAMQRCRAGRCSTWKANRTVPVLANVIFGQSFEQVNDKAELFRLILELLGDTTDAYAGKSEELSRRCRGAGHVVGSAAARCQ